MDEGHYGSLVHDEGLLNMSGSRILNTSVLELVHSEKTIVEVMGSGSTNAHHLEETSIHLPNKEPLLQDGSGTIMFPSTLCL